ncbi:MAG: hypothetical protein IPH13_02230 [Planctomycetes bacterium]|nr:hypothetical protein [Planctomycetota bacterium]MCC7171207.1 hypothetical protein [Planctomycetota bacterium]
MRIMLSIVTTAILAVLTSSAFARQDQKPQHPEHKESGHTEKHAPPAPGSDAEVIRDQGPSYPLTKCVVSGDEFGKSEKPIDYVVKGRLMRLCCEDCKSDVDKDPAAAIKKIDEAVVSTQKPSYPLTTDPVTGTALGKDAIDYVYGTRLVRLASKESIADFEKDPKAALGKVDQALIDAQRKTYPLKTCLVSGEELSGEMGESIDRLYGTRLVRFGCDSCVEKFEADPAKYLGVLDAATKEESKSDH